MAEITADAEHLQPKHRSSDDALAQCFPPGEASVSHLPRVAPNPFYPQKDCQRRDALRQTPSLLIPQYGPQQAETDIM